MNLLKDIAFENLSKEQLIVVVRELIWKNQKRQEQSLKLSDELVSLKKEIRAYARSPAKRPVGKRDTKDLLKKILKHRNSLFPFLYRKDIEADNKSSERSIRNFKVKQKISVQFKTRQNIFAILRSLVDTFIKNDMSVLESLQIVADMPAEPAEWLAFKHTSLD